MFMQSAAFVEDHKESVNEISVYSQEKVAEPIRLCKMNLGGHGLSGDIRPAVTYYEDIHKSVGEFDFVMASPPFNVDKVNKEQDPVKLMALIAEINRLLETKQQCGAKAPALASTFSQWTTMRDQT